MAGIPSVINLGAPTADTVLFRLDGAAANDYSGLSVASAGDVNGDGYADLVVGARFAAPGGRVNAGSAYVVYGSATGPGDLDLGALTPDQGFRIDGAAAGDLSGGPVASAGDVNGDGFDDLVIGAAGTDPDGRTNAGGAYVILGGATRPGTLDLGALTAAQGFRLDGAAAFDNAGRSVASAGDVNGDGLDDLMVGAPQAGPGGQYLAGSTTVVFGSAAAPGDLDLDALAPAMGFRLDGAAALDQSGRSVASAGDVNGDGFDDLVIGALFADPNGSSSGSAYVVFGSATGPGTPDLGALTLAQGFRLDGFDGEDQAGISVASAGDVNGDGFDDLVIGANGADPNGSSSGSAFVVFGSAAGPGDLNLGTLTAAQGFRLDGAAAIDNAGESVASAGDVNGDGYDDLLVGAPQADPGGRNLAGSTYVVFGEATSAVFRTAGPGGGRIVGGDFADRLTGGVGADILEGRDGNDTLAGGLGNDSLLGGAGADSLLGSGGADTLDGGAGNDTMAGGAGDDTYRVDAAGDVVTEAAGGGTDLVIASASRTLGAAVENLTLVGAGLSGTGNGLANRITGSAGNDSLSGLGGADTLLGGEGFDTLDGGDGNDLLEGGVGYNTLRGGDGLDTVTYAGAAEGAAVDLAGGFGYFGDYSFPTSGEDLLSGFENVVGSAYGDRLRGDGGANRLDGGAGADTLEGLAGADALVGGDGLDTASYDLSAAGVTVSLATGVASGSDAAGDTFSGIENLEGSSRADALEGDSGANRLDGGAGDDTLVGGGGADTFVGADADTVSYAGAAEGVAVSLLDGVGTAGEAADDAFLAIEGVIGTDHADTLAGGAADDTLDGGLGDDDLSGDAGNDSLLAGAGDDSLDGGTGADTMDGGADGDFYAVDDVGDLVVEATDDGEDFVEVSVDGWTLSANVEGAFLLTGGAFTGNDLANLVTADPDDGGANAVEALGGDDVVFTLFGNDTLSGGDGDDTLEGGDGADRIDGGADVDTASYVLSSAGVSVSLAAGAAVGGDAEGDTLVGIENLVGSSDDDTLTGDAEANQLEGDDGDDLLEGGAGADLLLGGDGYDVASYANSIDAVQVNLVTGEGVGGDAEGDVLEDIEDLTGSGGDDELTGCDCDSILEGGAGDDTVEGGTGEDTLDGGADLDTASYATAAAGVGVSLASGKGTVGDAAGDVLSGIENLTGSVHADSLRGDAAANVLLGGEGADNLVGAAGADVLDGGDGFDMTDYRTSRLGVSLDLDAGGPGTGLGTGGDAAGDTLSGIERVLGSNLDDTLLGGALGDRLEGMVGDDAIEGRGGDDLLKGAEGLDTLRGGEGADMLYGGAAADALEGGIGADRLYGEAGDDGLLGGDGADLLFGGDGADRLEGGLGRDRLTGGGGADRFVWTAAAESPRSGYDQLMDFDAAAGDRLDVSAFGASYVGAGAFPRDGNPSVGWRSSGGGADVQLVLDENGDGFTDLFVTLYGVASLSLGDFIL